MLINGESYFSLRQSFKVDHKNIKTDNSTDNVKTKKQIYDEFKEKVKAMLDPTSGMSDQEKAVYEDKVNQKIENGEELSDSEMRYIRIKSPYMYRLISRVQMQRQALKDKLKNCRSKEEVEDAYNFCISHIDKDDPAKKPLVAAYNNVTQEFKKSGEYKALPQKTDKKDEKNKEPIIKNSKAEKFEIESKYLSDEVTLSAVDYIV